jgi:hypothetical protein
MVGVVCPDEALAQAPPPSAPREDALGTVSTITMIVGASTVTFMPRIYYSDPEATVGWKARWHVSQLAPALALTSLTLLVDGPIKDLGEGTRPGCTVAETEPSVEGSNCESYGMPSTHSFASWSATGAGTGIWVADTFIHSDSELHAGSLIGNVIFPLTLSIVTSVTRGVGTDPYEDGGQIAVGIAAGLPIGFLTGIAYAILQEPNCGYGDNLICW